MKRDNFTCQYCGRKPPEVILEIDHIIPVSKKGSIESENLITACRDCNRAKKDRSVNIKKPGKIYLPENVMLSYNAFSARLSDDNIEWLKSERINFKSWNLLFNDLRKHYGNGTPKNLANP